STLNVRLSPNFQPKLGDQFTILQNPAGLPIQGAFTGLPEGAVFFLGNLAFQISYVGGTRHDIVLTRGVRSAAALAASAPAVPLGQPVAVTAAVARTGTGAGTPTGVVVFAEGPMVLQTTTLTNGQASFATTALTSGSHTIAAGYAGDGTFVGSTSAAVTVT